MNCSHPDEHRLSSARRSGKHQRQHAGSPGDGERALAEEARVVRELSTLHERVHDKQGRVLDAADGSCPPDRSGCEAEADEDCDSAAATSHQRRVSRRGLCEG